MAKQQWGDLSQGQQRGILAAGAVQLVLTVIAWIDLYKRPATQVRGPKRLWAVLIPANMLGSVSYLVWGRHRSVEPS